MLKGRFNFHLVSAQGKLYAVGGEGPFSEHDDIEVGENSGEFTCVSTKCFMLLDLRSPKQ